MESIPKRPSLKEIEKKWQDWWEEEEIYRFDSASENNIYSIDVPPRYVSGPLHIGHAISYTHIDFAARFHRMTGCNVFNPLCFDVNGLPIEVNVEKQGISPRIVGRERFIEECDRFGEKNIAIMTDQFKRLGHSFDPSIYYQTNSDSYRRVTQITFIEMYEKGHIYRGEHPVNWCPRCRTALSDAEVVYTERDSFLNYIKFYLKDASVSPATTSEDEHGKYVTIATTRPELLPACVMVMVHPDDDRHRWLVGRTLITPLFGNEVEVVADEVVDPNFGTGIVMICTFGDREDIEAAFKYGRDFIKVINEEGKLTQKAGKFKGLEIEEGEKKVLEELEEEGLLVEKAPLRQRVNCCWRCETPIEYIVTTQWFLRILPFKEDIKRLAKEMEWYPDFMRERLINWVDSLRWDWCISRQRYFATPIPVWMCQNCEDYIVAKREQCYTVPTRDPAPVEKCPSCGGELKGSEEVFDTWFDSSISAMYNAHYVRDENLFLRLHPLTMRPQSHDIIRTWAFYSILRSFLLTGKFPFRQVVISGYIMGPDGRPMHSSWGNVVDPLEVIDEFGTEALRYFAAHCGLGVDTAFNWEKTKHGESYMVKLWNISRFVLGHIKDYEPPRGIDSPLDASLPFTVMDRWLWSHLSSLVDDITWLMQNYDYNRSIIKLEEFMWHTLADNYLEIVKHRLFEKASPPSPGREAARCTLYHALLYLLKMLAPLLSHITEEIYSFYFREKEGVKSIHLSQWPILRFDDPEAEEKGDRAVEVISTLRKWKQSRKMGLGTPVESLGVSMPWPESLEEVRGEVAGTMRVRNLRFLKGDELKVVEEF